jgi:hypothetical protein
MFTQVLQCQLSSVLAILFLAEKTSKVCGVVLAQNILLKPPAKKG